MEQGLRREPLYQVMATETSTGKLVAMPMFPRIGKEAADEFCATVRTMILQGKEMRYADPQAVLLLPTH